jgi:TonB family protein
VASRVQASEPTPAPDQILPGDNALTVIEVDSEVVRDPTSAAPEYPAQLLAKGLEGWAMVRYVVDTLGQVDTLTYRVLQATHMGFARAVRLALPNMRFRPAIQSGNRVRQLVEQTFRFRISASDSSRPAPHA